MKFWTFILLLLVGHCHGITNRDLYDINVPGSQVLQQANEESVQFTLNAPIHFFTEKYDSIYININGILTFVNEFPEFLNIPFPIEYPAISAFYSNIDTSFAEKLSSISYYQTIDTNLLSRASSVVRSAFSDANDFRARSLVVVTWNNVPKWKDPNLNEGTNELNTFQVAIISNDEESYVEFLYPQNGIKWIQAEIGESGLPDIRARAGFVSADGKYTELKGSGTDKVRFLTETSNYGQSGRWLYRVGKLSEGENVEEPDNNLSQEEIDQPLTCASGGRLQCHSAATCEDTQDGFCCKCKSHYYGNGFSCIRDNIPIRVTGTITGHIGTNNISSQLQAYIVMVDGRAYTAMSTLNGDVGPKFQLLEIIGGVIGWLFAKPVGETLNGYQITGGKFNHTSNLRFQTGEILHITQRYIGLNLWDQLAAEVEISGDSPDVREGVKATMEDFVEEYTSSNANGIQAVSKHRVQLSSGEPDIEFTIYQDIKYETCAFLEEAERKNNVNGRLRTSKISLGYYSQENAVRISTVTKIGLTDKTNPCLEGTANCGDNTICVPTQDDGYECQCKNGYTFATATPERGAPEVCVDIDECSSSHICSEFAQCHNQPGGYECVCHPGYEGNGYECQRIEDHQTTTPHYQQPAICGECSENGFCSEGVCVCRPGFIGNGHDCRPICALNEVFDGVTCVKIASIPEDDVQPICSQAGCVCPRGYKLIEYAFNAVCRQEEQDTETESQTTSCDVINNCHPFANCEFDQNLYRYQCVCGPGYDGNGIDCIEIEANCAHEDICDVHADCAFNATLHKNVCVCHTGYEGNGKTCQLAAECSSSADCGYHSVCVEGICECSSGFERDTSDLCVPVGSCNGAFCAENAQCRFDERQRVNYCYCPEGFIGDGINECRSVPPPCNVRNNCGLYASCVPNYRTSSYECTCDDGYSGDGFICTLERHCANMPELCDPNAECTTTSNGYQCVCNQGFIGNGSVCKEPPKLESGFLIVSQGVAAVKIPLSGNKRGVPVSTASMAIGVDKDCAEGRVYWSDISAKAIFSAKYDGTDKKTFVSENIMSPEGVAVDWVSRRIYWTDSGKDTIEVASLDNSTLRTVVINRGLVNPRGIAVDPHQNKIFWSDWNRLAPKIESANLDGTDRQTLAESPQVKLPNSLALSLSTGQICYADAGNQRIECLDTYSRQSRIIADKLSYPFGLAITDDHFFWSDWTTKKIESCDYDGNRKSGIQTPLFSSHKMYGMTAVIDRCPIYFTPCNANNGDCPADHICLVNQQAPSGKSCKCITQGACNILDE